MTKTRRIIHHACWFALLGPHIGVVVTLIREIQTSSRTPAQLLLEILTVLPIFMALTWIIGGISALLTGIATACLPPRIYHCGWQRIVISGATGALIASAYWLLLIRDMDAEFIWMSAGPGLFAGLMMGWLVPRLPFRGKKNDTGVTGTPEPGH
ncbi:MAG: hypothetical protein LBE93_05315 [Enterobacter asburiae]|jgi:hypothetical protein|nr:hypothetical protein [Enterobacter asburiae]